MSEGPQRVERRRACSPRPMAAFPDAPPQSGRAAFGRITLSRPSKERAALRPLAEVERTGGRHVRTAAFRPKRRWRVSAAPPPHPTQNGGGVADTSCVGTPIRYRGAHSRTGKDRVGLESVNEPMVLGRVRVDPGDMVAVDGSCAVVVPRAGGRRAAHRRDRGQGGFALARPPGRDGPRRGAPAPRLRHAAVGARVAAAHRPGAGTGDDAASRPSSQPGGSAAPTTRPMARPLARSRRGGKDRRGRVSLQADHHEIGPGQGSARVSRKPVSRIQPMRSAAV